MPKPAKPPAIAEGPRLRDFEPMLLTARRVPLADESGWLAEIKFDGYRMMAEFEPGRAELKSRGGADASKWFPEIVTSLAGLDRGRNVVDGEMCVLDEHGRSDFDAVHERALRRRRVPGAPPAVYCVFDLLVHRGVSIVDRPLVERKALLAKLLTPAPPSLLYVQHLEGNVAWLYGQALQLQLEGVVAKRAESPYLSGERASTWLKLKRPGATPAGRFSRK